MWCELYQPYGGNVHILLLLRNTWEDIFCQGDPRLCTVRTSLIRAIRVGQRVRVQDAWTRVGTAHHWGWTFLYL
jgi:hypothetical protein